ncbi:HD-GYP domain-containing protein [Halalkalibacter kiskunsagensis]|uniref:HD-GYP domain-containing protein n=1 Tax=Halalkalibacter kiskunsagensis TaxID=1548599 RepID=A0ABV6KII1_9BACI
MIEWYNPNKWLDNPIIFKWIFIIVWMLAALVNGILLTNYFIYPLYILTVIFLGIGYFDKPKWLLVLLATGVVLTRIFLSPEPSTSLELFFLHWFTYVIILFISVSLMRSYQDTKRNQIELNIALSKSLNSRDSYTAHHSQNVAYYAMKIAKEMKICRSKREALYLGGLLHDIGKIGIPESVLTKPEKLSTEEFEVIKLHPVIGYDMIKHIVSFKENGVLDMTLYHHERYDGKGYPKGLKGEDIPLVARVITVADAFDAMTSKRIYRNELDWKTIVNELEQNKGKQFDPAIIDVFLKILQREGKKIVENCKAYKV